MPSKPPRVREGLIDRVWYAGDDALAAGIRTALVPIERAYAAAVAVRSAYYGSARGLAADSPIPCISVGNVSVGGTGKTPVAAWIAATLVARGARPAIVLRGYGGDEALVHGVLNPGVPVVESIDRPMGVVRAAAEGADVAVLDDAFQHRRARRLIDVVLVSADRWSANLRLLPAGPWREPIHGIGRATLVVITRKAARDDQVDAASRALARIAPAVPQATVRLAPDTLRQLGDASAPELPIEAIAGRRVHLVAAIGDPRALAGQLEAAGGIVRADFFRDHHPFSDAELTAIRGRVASESLVVCTLKDAVKVGNRWPREAPPLWYVSQRVIVERGGSAIEHGLDDLLRARHQTAPTAG